MSDRPKTDAWGCPIWYPDEAPFRVFATYRSNSHYHHGWVSGRPQTFATEAEARAAVKGLSRRGLINIYIHYAENAATWRRNGRWRLVEKFKPEKMPAHQ